MFIGKKKVVLKFKKKKKHCASVCVILICLPCMMLLLWLVVEGFWDRPRLVGFGSAAAAPEQTKEQFGAVSLCLYIELFHFTVLNAAEPHIRLNCLQLLCP